ncbi:hypothetical protein SVAN01_05438 [Stagonosporopsis vannaccii]|nr:hypothetical protein SVAN01_05438 [Stagonosporopsis vannaccii]
MSKYILCTATSVQLGHQRFPDRHERPRIKAWRCDLTALSRSHNFYFVACNDTIHVYQPRFPDQSIPGEPELVLHPPTSSPNLRYGIDPEDPHSITRLHVDYLGQDEIILVTCDDGDVIGYRTDEIQRVFDKQREALDDQDGLRIEESVRTFLHRNVGASAWGLAIHREARMIAISANTEKVTVIAYALAQLDNESDNTSLSSGSGLDDCSDEENPADFPSPRRQDHVIVLSASHNVPSVSFNNSGDDPSGRWLSSCSIVGETLIWDLHNPTKPVRTIRLGFCASTKDPTKAPKLRPGTCACLRPSTVPHAMWSTMFLDANSAYDDSSLQNLTPPLDHPLPYIKDLGECKHQFSVRQRSSPLMTTVSTNETLFNSAAHVMDLSETESVTTEDDWIPSTSSSESNSNDQLNQFEESNMEVGVSAGFLAASQQHPGPAELLGTVLNAAPNVDAAQPPPPQAPSNAINAFGAWYQPPNQTPAADFTYEDSDSEDELFIPTFAQVHMAFANAIQPARAYCEIITAFTMARQPHITSPFLIVTKEDVHLYQRPLDYVGDHAEPIITIRQPLHPEKHQSPFPFIPGSHDRHCYTTQIPELGVFIIASPHGRAGVFSLTKSMQKPRARPLYSFHLEYVLPFANDDKTKIWDVEGTRLVGVAAGPVQGMLDRSDRFSGDSEEKDADCERCGSRRWRVLMYFTNHTVLAFELGRRRAGEMPEVDELIV